MRVLAREIYLQSLAPRRAASSSRRSRRTKTKRKQRSEWRARRRTYKAILKIGLEWAAQVRQGAPRGQAKGKPRGRKKRRRRTRRERECNDNERERRREGPRRASRVAGSSGSELRPKRSTFSQRSSFSLRNRGEHSSSKTEDRSVLHPEPSLKVPRTLWYFVTLRGLWMTAVLVNRVTVVNARLCLVVGGETGRSTTP